MDEPPISVVIPTLRRPQKLARTLSRLHGQVAAADEVIVVDDDDEGGPEPVASATGERPYDVRVVRAAGRNVSAARNVGWREARHPVVLFLGDDILPTPGLVAAHRALHAAHPEAEAAALGRVVWATELRITPFMAFLDRGVQFDFGGIDGEEAGYGRFYTANVSVKRTLLEAVDGFDESFRFFLEDLDLGLRMSRVGLRLYYAPDAVGEHLHASTLEDWRRRMVGVARAEQRMMRKHPDFVPFFHTVLSPWRDRRVPGARVARMLADVVPEAAPVVGRRVHARAVAAYKRELADAYEREWDALGAPTPVAS